QKRNLFLRGLFGQGRPASSTRSVLSASRKFAAMVYCGPCGSCSDWNHVAGLEVSNAKVSGFWMALVSRHDVSDGWLYSIRTSGIGRSLYVYSDDGFVHSRLLVF